MTALDTTRRLRRSRMRLLAVLLAMFALAAFAGAVATQLWQLIGTGMALLVAAGLLAWLATWLPGADPNEASVAVRKRALLTMVAAVAAVVVSTVFIPR